MGRGRKGGNRRVGDHVPTSASKPTTAGPRPRSSTTPSGADQTAVLTSPVSIPEARSRARGLYAERSRRFVVGSGLADGLPRLRAGRSVRLGGLGPIFDGVYHLVATRHLFTVGEGYRTEFDAERPGVGAA